MYNDHELDPVKWNKTLSFLLDKQCARIAELEKKLADYTNGAGRDNQRILEIEKTLVDAQNFYGQESIQHFEARQKLAEAEKKLVETEAQAQQYKTFMYRAIKEKKEADKKLSITARALEEISEPKTFSARSDVAAEALAAIKRGL